MFNSPQFQKLKGRQVSNIRMSLIQTKIFINFITDAESTTENFEELEMLDDMGGSGMGTSLFTTLIGIAIIILFLMAVCCAMWTKGR